MISRTLHLKELLSKTIEPAILVVDEKLSIQYQSQNTAHYIKLPETFTNLKQLDSRNKIAFTSATKKAIQSIKSYADIKVIENLILKNKSYTINLKIQKLQTKPIKDALFSISISKFNSSETPIKRALQNDKKNKIKQIGVLEDKLSRTLTELNLLKKEHECLKSDFETTHKNLEHVKTEYDINLSEQYELNFFMTEMLKNSNVATVFLNLELQIIKYTPLLSHLFDVENRDIGRKITDFNHVFTSNDWVALLKNAKNSDSKIELELTTKDDQYYLMIINPAKFSHVSTNVLSVSFVNISLQVKANQDKVASELKFRTLFESSVDGMAIIDLDKGSLVASNEKMPQMLGITKKEYLNTNPINFVPEFQSDGTESRAVLEKLHNTLRQKGQVSQIVEHKHKTKGSFFARFSKYKIPSFNQNYAAVVLHDIDKEIKTIEALKASKSRHKAFFNQSLDGHVILNVNDLKPVEVNQRLLKMFRISKTEYFNANPIDFFDAENNFFNVEEAFSNFRASLEKNKPFEIEVYIKTKKRKSFLVKVLINQLSAPNQHLVYAVIKDIDKERKAEEATKTHLKALTTSEARHIAFFNQSLDGHIILDAESMMPVEVNKRMLQMLRISKTEYFNASPYDLFDAEINSIQVDKIFQDIKAHFEKNKTFEVDVYLKSNKRKSFLAKVLVNQLSAPNQHLVYVVIKDIDKEHKAEEAAKAHLTALTASESMHKNFFNQSLDAHIVISKENMMPVEVNDRVLKLLRIPKTEFFNTDLYAFCDSDKNKITQAQFFDAIQASLIKNIPYEAEMYMKSRKRKSFLAKLLFNQMSAPNEHLLYAVIKDIDSEHKAKEAADTHLKALVASESMFRTFFENGLDGFGIAQIFPKPKPIDVNPRMLELTGLSKKEFINSNILDFLNPIQANNKSGREVFDEITQSLIKRGFYRGDVVYRHKKNGPFYTNITMVRLKPPNDNKVFIQIKDKDKEVKALQKVAKSEALFKSIFANSLDGIVIYNIETFEPIDCNDRVLEMTNCTRRQFENSNTRDFLPEKQPDGKDSFSVFKKYLKNVTENKSINREWLFKRYNSNELVHARISIIRLPQPFTKLAVISIADITETKLSEQAILEKNKAIQQTNKQLKDSLKRFNDTFANSVNYIARFDLEGHLIEHNITINNNLIDKNVVLSNTYAWNLPRFSKHREAQKRIKHDFELAKKGDQIKSQVPYTVSPNFSGTLEYTLKPIKNDKGDIFTILVEGFDVTEQVNTLKRLQINEQKFRAIYDNSSNFIGIFDKKGILLDHNQTVSDKLENNQIQSVGMPLWDFPWFTMHKESQQEYKRAIKKAQSGKVASGTVKYSTSPKFTGTMKYDFNPIFDEKGKVIWILGEGKDITEIINTQKELSYKEQKFRAVFNNSSNLMGLYDTDGFIDELNQPLLKRNGETQVSMALKKVKVWNRPLIANFKESQETFKASFKKALKGEIDRGIIQYEPAAHQTGILEYTLSPIFDENNKVIKVLGEGKDITEKIEVQKEIEASEKKFRDLFYKAKNRIVRLSPSGKVIAHNKIHRGRRNYTTTKKYIGKYLWELLVDTNTKDSYQQIKQDFAKAVKGELVSNTLSITNSKNEKLILSYSLKPVLGVDKKVEWVLGESNDITEITKTQKQLLENEQKFKAIFYNSENYIIRLDAEGNVLEHSRMHPDSSSYNLVKRNIGKALWEFPGISDYPISAQQLKKDIQKCTKGNFVANQMQMWVRKTDGRKNQPDYKTGLVTYTLTPVFDKNQKVDWILAEAKNISELDEAQKKLSLSSNKYQKLFENNLVGIITLDENLKIIECNKAYEKFMGYSLKDAKSLDYYTLIDPKEIEEAKRNEQKIKSTRVQSLQFKRTFTNNTGEKIIANVYLKPIYINNKLSSAIVTIADVSELESNRKALKESENKYRSLFENNITGLALGNQYGQILQVNKALCNMFGYSENEMLQLKHQNLSAQGKDDQSYKHFRAMVDGRIKKFSTTKNFIKKNGTIFYAIINVSGIYNEESQFLYNITSISDISELKLLENALKEKQIELADKVVELEKYIESNLELENFAFIASHDLKSPTQTIIDFSNLLADKAAKKLDIQEQQFLKFIIDGSERLQNTIRDLLHFSLANNNTLSIEKVDVRSLIKDVIKDLNSEIKNTGAIIKIEGLPTYNWIDKGLYKGLFLNLISNGIKFQKSGNKAVIKIICTKTDTGYLFAVKDNGIGIPKKSQHKIFGIFKRLHTYTEYEGTGIGLALCKKVVEKHKGKIWVESARWKGTTFYFTLPGNLK